MTAVRKECSATFSLPVPRNWYPLRGVLRSIPASKRKSARRVSLSRPCRLCCGLQCVIKERLRTFLAPSGAERLHTAFPHSSTPPPHRRGAYTATAADSLRRCSQGRLPHRLPMVQNSSNEKT